MLLLTRLDTDMTQDILIEGLHTPTCGKHTHATDGQQCRRAKIYLTAWNRPPGCRELPVGKLRDLEPALKRLVTRDGVLPAKLDVDLGTFTSRVRGRGGPIVARTRRSTSPSASS